MIKLVLDKPAKGGEPAVSLTVCDTPGIEVALLKGRFPNANKIMAELKRLRDEQTNKG
ncbi:MAG: hypothetical protein ACFCVH_15840 [Alphaproteobacteria bacterium]